MKGAYVNKRLKIETRESETGNWFLVPYLSKRLGYCKTVDREQGIGNRELVPCSFNRYILQLLCFKSASREEGASSWFLYKYNWVYTSFWFCLFHHHVRHLMILKRYRYLSAYYEYCQVNVERAYIIIWN